MDGHRSVISRASQDGAQGEAEYIFRSDRFNLSAGTGAYNTDRDLVVGPPIQRPFGRHFPIEQQTGYVYSNINIPYDVTWTLGFSYDDFQQRDLHLAKFNPKLGVQWLITEDITLRLAAFRTVQPALIFNRTIQPTQVAGFNQFFDDANGTEAWSYGAGLDTRLTDDLNAGVELFWRNLKQPILTRRKTFVEGRNEDLVRTYVYWAPLPTLAFTSEFRFDVFDGDTGLDTDLPSQVDTLSLPVSVRYFDPLGFFGGVTGTLVHQDVTRNAKRIGTGEKSALPEGADTFEVVDAVVGYPNGGGLISLEVGNIFDTGFKFQDDSFRLFQDASTISPYLPKRTVLGRVYLNF